MKKKNGNYHNYGDTYCTTFSLSGILESVDKFAGLAKLMVNFALKDGSSKQGKALLASVGENWVLTINLPTNSFFKTPVSYMNENLLGTVPTFIQSLSVFAAVKALHVIVDFSNEIHSQTVLLIFNKILCKLDGVFLCFDVVELVSDFNISVVAETRNFYRFSVDKYLVRMEDYFVC